MKVVRLFCLLIVLSMLVFSLIGQINSSAVVDQTGMGDHVGIQAAIDAAAPGDTIEIWSGTYNEKITVDKPLTIIGNGSSETVINYVGTGHLFTITSDYVNISNLSLTGSGGDNRYSALFLNGVDDCNVRDVEIYDYLGFGLYLYNSNHNRIDFNNLHGNDNSGIFLFNSHHNDVGNNLFTGNLYGIRLASSNGNCILDNNASNNLFSGLVMVDSCMNIIDNNTLWGHPERGLFAGSGCNSNIVTYNDLRYNDGTGMFIRISMHNLIENNRFFSNGLHGLAFENADHNNVSYNLASENKIGFYIRTDSQYNNFSHNQITNNINWSFMITGSENNTVFQNNMSENRVGIFTYGSNNNTYAENLFFRNGECAVRSYLLPSNDNRFVSNIMEENEYGIFLTISSGNIIENNVISNNTNQGITLVASDANFILNNSFHNNGKEAVNLSSSNDNDIHHNNFFNANEPVYDDGANDWHDGYPRGGNYWDHMNGTDSFHGPLQNMPGPDGYYDSPYNIGAGSNRDLYPLAQPWFLDEEDPIADAGEDQLVEQTFTVTFNGSASTDNVGIVNYTWTFFDMVPITLYGMMAEYQFDNAGLYTVTLTVTDAADNSDSDDTLMNLTVELSLPPAADAGPNQTVNMGETVTFDGSNSSDNVGISNYTWYLVDGFSVLLYGVAPMHLFQDAGVYEVVLTITDTVDNTHTDNMTVTVLDTEPPVAVAGYSLSVSQGDVVSFNGSNSTDNVAVSNHTWTMMDRGEFAYYGPILEYRFCNADVVTVTLNVSDAAGNWHHDTIEISVQDTEAPAAEGRYSLYMPFSSTVHFDALASHDNIIGIGSGIVNYTWEVSEGENAFELYGVAPCCDLLAAGTYNITLSVTDAHDNWNSTYMQITIAQIIAGNSGWDFGVPWLWLMAIVLLALIFIMAVKLHKRKVFED